MKDRRSLKTESKNSSPAMTHSHLQMRPFATADQAQSQQQSESSRRSDFNLASLSIQPKLTIGQPNDKYEQEADRVAAQVVKHISSPQVQETSAKEDEVQRVVDVSGLQKVMAAQEDVQAQGDVSAGAASADFESSLSRARGGGSPLGAKVRGQMESAMGADFSSVKIHTDNRSDQLNRSIQAKAFTTGNDIFFQQGAYNPGSSDGQALIAHELTHTIQQGAATSHVQRIVTDEIETLGSYCRLRKDSKTKNAQQALEHLETYNRAMLDCVAPGPAQRDNLIDARTKLLKEIDFCKEKKTKLLTRSNWSAEEQRLETICFAILREIDALAQYFEVTAELVFLGGGALNKVYQTLFKDGADAVWKADQAKLGNGDIENMCEMAGIGEMGELQQVITGYDAKYDDSCKKIVDEESPIYTKSNPRVNFNQGGRNIAMYRLDQLLKTGVIPRTETAKVDGKMGTLMGLESGTSVAQLLTEKRAEEKLVSLAAQRDLSNLQLLDAISGQIDRHAGNIIATIDEKTGEIIGLKGIDNDLAFGINMTATQDIPVSHERGFPELIDHEVADRIVFLSKKTRLIERTLAGLLTEKEIQATIVRLIAVAEYINYVRDCDAKISVGKSQRIIKEWNKETFDTQIQFGTDRVQEEIRKEKEEFGHVKKGRAEARSRSYLYQHVETERGQKEYEEGEIRKAAEKEAQLEAERQEARLETERQEAGNAWQRPVRRGDGRSIDAPLARRRGGAVNPDEAPVINQPHLTRQAISLEAAVKVLG
jgi:Domain of unknown function (DUF4157)